MKIQKYNTWGETQHQQQHNIIIITPQQSSAAAIRRLELRQTITIRHGPDTLRAPLTRRRALLLGSVYKASSMLRLSLENSDFEQEILDQLRQLGSV